MYGTGHLGREHARDMLRRADAAGIAQAVDQAAKTRFYNRHTLLAGWN